MIGLFIGLYFVAVGVFKLLSLVAPVLILLAAIIHYRTLLDFVSYMLGLLRRKPLVGILGILLSVVGFPILSAILFAKSILDRKIRRLEKAYLRERQEEYVDFEEIVPNKDEASKTLPPLTSKLSARR